MIYRLFRINGLPPLTAHLAKFKAEWKEGYDGVLKNLGKFQECDAEAQAMWPKLLDALERDLYLKYPRQSTIHIATGDDLTNAINEYGALSFCIEKDDEGKPAFTCYILDHGT